jgi:hypothetical protein
MAVKSVEEATRAIPVIDFAAAFRGRPGALDAAAAEVRHACERIGFFYMAGHGVPQAVIDAAFEASREFHALPLEEKMRLKLNENNIGYLPVNQSMQCLPSCAGRANPPCYPPAVYRDLVLDFYNANYFHREGYAARAAS